MLIFPKTLIDKLSVVNESYEEMDYVELDICEPMEVIDNDSFDMIIDKATLDAVLCNQKPQERVLQMMENIYRILAPGGIYISISNGIPETREQIFKMKEWSIERGEIPSESAHEGDNMHHIYVMTK
ncbi:unnamed protein product [Moneuplotes crassus]|uniref:Methyltransferase type 11 domain-containing protein n=1 Tax=Euplotes crassus TaxID=5936 RepID=A0AAD1XVW7_EUPCR|nr:unnamed protein product [Moneuplotes crassus]|mmetsp:Transcript_25139/g.24891  ORF Transcript_25139/g.24891 Transcript_25139/m.24891 type:complete len:127 (-) Transcript_25139:3-383(-)